MQRPVLFFAAVLGAASLLGVACGDNEPNDPAEGQGGAGGGGGAASAVGCGESQAVCDELCTNLDSDPANCGECGTGCGIGEGCLQGECLTFGCTTGQVVCDEACVILQTDEAHCGECGSACAAGELCISGVCETNCKDSQLVCEDECIDPQSDSRYCGAQSCDEGGAVDAAPGSATCEAGQVCVGAECVPSCPNSQVSCDERCVDPLTDRAYCGATLESDCTGTDAGTACAEGEVCAVGTCATSCLEDQVECGGLCIDPQTDRAYCGATLGSGCVDADAGTACADGEVCVAGLCENSCPAGQIECSDRCIDPESDPTFCGATDCSAESTDGEVCGLEATCVLGKCRGYLFEWSVGERVSIENWATADNESAIGVDDSGNAIVVYRQFESSSQTGNNFLYASRYDALTGNWAEPEPLSTRTAPVTNPALAVAGNGDAVAVWREDGSYQNIYLSVFDESAGVAGQWGPAILVDTTNQPAETPSVGVDDAGKAHIVWAQEASGQFRVHRRTFNLASGAFDGPPIVFSGYAHQGTTSSFPRVAVSDAGKAGIIWRDTGGGFFGVDYDTVSWGTVTRLTSKFPSNGNFQGRWDIDIDSTGNLLAAYNVYNESTTTWETWGSRFNESSGNWEAETALVDDSEGNSFGVDIAASPDGRFVISYWRGTFGAGSVLNDVIRVEAKRFSAAGAELQTQVLDDSFDTLTTPNPVIDIAVDGTVQVVWKNGNTASAREYSPSNIAWLAPVEIAPGSPVTGYPVIAAVESSRAYAGYYSERRYYVSAYE